MKKGCICESKRRQNIILGKLVPLTKNTIKEETSWVGPRETDIFILCGLYANPDYNLPTGFSWHLVEQLSFNNIRRCSAK